MPAYTVQALHQLRDPSQFKWYAVFFLGAVLYVYAVEIERRNWSLVLAGLAFWGMDWFNEVVNALVLHFSHHAAIWTVTGSTAFQIFVGLNFEISALFAISGIVFAKQLPPDPALRLWGIPNRWLMVLGFALFGVLVEAVILNPTGYWHWSYWWWNSPWLILDVIFGYGTFFAAAAWVHDMRSVRSKLTFVGTLGALDLVLIAVFGLSLGWL